MPERQEPGRRGDRRDAELQFLKNLGVVRPREIAALGTVLPVVADSAADLEVSPDPTSHSPPTKALLKSPISKSSSGSSRQIRDEHIVVHTPVLARHGEIAEREVERLRLGGRGSGQRQRGAERDITPRRISGLSNVKCS